MNNVMPLRDHKGILWERGKRQRPSEGELADRLAERHSNAVRFMTGRERIHRRPALKAQWIYWAGQEWLFDEANLALRLARQICKEAAAERDEPAIDSARSVSGVLSLAKCDPRLVVADWPPHPAIESAVYGWLADKCELDAAAWIPRADLLATFTGWERFYPGDLMAALEAHGVTYRRKGNVHGFDGVELRGDDDVQ
jgi:hypothetical protein